MNTALTESVPTNEYTITINTVVAKKKQERSHPNDIEGYIKDRLREHEALWKEALTGDAAMYERDSR